MIERYIENQLTLKRWRRFKARKLSVYSAVIILFAMLLTFAAPLIANNKPVILSYNSKVYFPVFKNYDVSDFGDSRFLIVDYKNLELGEDDWAVWPLIKWNPYESNHEVSYYPAAPSKSNIMGTDDRGRDVFARLLYGFKFSIVYAVAVWLVSFVIGTILGGTMGFLGGKVDFFGQRMVEIFSTVPQFFLLIILISIFTPNIWWLIAISSLFSWIAISYYVRGEFLKNRNKEFVEAARSVGASTKSIIFKHILPNSLTPIITFSPFVIAGNISSLAALDYLGFGLEVPTPSWGELLSQAQKNFTIAWWLALYPSLALFFTLMLLNFIGDGVRDAMDPNLNN